MQSCSDPTCGHPNRPSARFCERCGQPLRAARWTALRTGQLMRGGAYRILEPLGKGGMGALYLAADTGAFDRLCVVKELLDYYDPTDPAEARRAQARFEQEARLLAELSHPGIPRIFSYFSEAGRHYIVMEYIEGETLEQAVSHANAQGQAVPARPLATEEVVRHAIRICRVLEYLAAQPTPVIHHDIKPANLIVDRASGEVRLVDFGTAQIRTPWAAQTRRARGATSAFGTEGYAAPEVFQGHSEPRSDVFALGATAYHLLTDDDPADHPFEFPRLPTLPGPLADALGRALRPETRRRSTALEFRQGLEAWLQPEAAAEPFVFRDGSVARTTQELAILAEPRWAESRQHLAASDFDRWFLARNRHDLVAKAKSARLEGDADAGLEAFLRRLNSRLAPPRLALEPATLDFGRVHRLKPVVRRLVLRNETRGYGQATFTASVRWLEFDPPVAGCLAGEQAVVEVWLHPVALPLRREQQAVVAAATPRGTRLSVPVEVELDLAAVVLQRTAAWLGRALRLLRRGARWGIGTWTHALGRLARSRIGPWVLGGETLLLALALTALIIARRGGSVTPPGVGLALLSALPLAGLAVYLLPAAAFVAAGAFREAWLARRRCPPEDRPPATGAVETGTRPARTG